MDQSTYAHEAGAPDYRHESHAGNIGDVWKHCVLTSILLDLLKKPDPLTVFDTHAGDGLYKLKSTGEWSAGIERVLKYDLKTPPAPLERYLEFVKSRCLSHGKLESYPGSPLLISSLLRDSDLLVASEIVPEVLTNLKRSLVETKQSTIIGCDGLAALSDRIKAVNVSNQILIHIDPPWNAKQDWITIPKLIIEVAKQCPKAVMALWYPIKSYARVNQMRRELSKAKVNGVAAELLTTPLEIKRNRLNGSGMIIINGANCVIEEIASCAIIIGRACATHEGYFQSNITQL